MSWSNTAIAVGALATIGYLIYFDQRRQRDPEFRKRLQQKNASRTASSKKRSAQDIDMSLNDMDEPVPTNQQEKEQYFVKQLSLAEELMSRGPQFFEPAAKCLLKVVKIYPDPMQLLMILEQSTPQPVFSILMDLMAAEMKPEPEESRIEDIDE